MRNLINTPSFVTNICFILNNIMSFIQKNKTTTKQNSTTYLCQTDLLSVWACTKQYLPTFPGGWEWDTTSSCRCSLRPTLAHTAHTVLLETFWNSLFSLIYTNDGWFLMSYEHHQLIKHQLCYQVINTRKKTPLTPQQLSLATVEQVFM